MYQIYSKLGVLKYESDNLEYNGEFMGVCNVSMNIESPYPIYFRIGDYVIYRGERFELNYIPTELKQSSSGSYGAAYKYDNVVFNSLSDELTNCMFYDYVQNDNLMHYSSLPVFSFYADSISALADRIQVNLDRIYEGERKWTVIVHPEYVNEKNKNISVNNITVWDALALANTEFKANFIIRGRTITIGTAGLSIGKLFSYGEGNGLYSIQKTADSGQRIVTRLRAYGSARNMPLRYYSDANKSYVATVTDKITNSVGVDSNITVFADFDLDYSPQLFTTKRVKQGEQRGWVVKVELKGTIVTGVITSKEGTVRNCQLEVFYDINAVDDNGTEPSYEAINAFKDKIEIGSKVRFVAGISKANFPNDHIVHEIDIPSNFAINNLMLPSFPTETLDPYIDSENIEELGVREWSIFFDGSNPDLPEICPSIEGMTADELKSAGVSTESTGKLDEIAKRSVNADGTTISDSGEYTEGETVPNFKIYLKDIGFDINDYLIPDQNASISMTSGMCGGREFEILGGADKPYKEDGMWVLTCHRQEDSALNLYFPYKDYTIEDGDTFVLLNIAMPKEYIKAASQRLLTESKAWLSKNDFVRYSYEPKVDEVLMMKNPELHDSIKEGDLMLFNDEDLGIDGSIIIEKLSIKEGDSAAPTYEVVLRNDKVVGTIEKIQNQIDSIVSGGQGSGGYTAQQINKFISTYGEKYFLSKNKIDAAKEIITFEKGIVLGKEENAKIDDKGRAELLSGVVKELLRSKTFVDGLSGQGWKIWMENALSHMTVDKLTVRQTMVAFEMLIDKIRSVGGSICVSAANGKIKSVEEDDNGYFVTFEQDNTFVKHDLIRCSTFSGDGLKNYWAEVSEVDGDRIFLSKSEFDSYIPETGDECVLMGNTTNPHRQNMILISATDDGQPRIDVMDGVKDKNFDGCLRMRAGNLDGINDDWFPIDNQPHGNGIYSDNAYLRGTFLLVTGEDIRTKFEIVEGKITSSIEALRDDLSKDVGYLNNPSFSEGLDKWNTQNEATFFLVNNKWIWANNNVLSKRGNSAKVLNDDGRMVVELRNSYIIQKRENLKSVPTMPQNANGDKEAIPIFLNFFYKCKKEGTLNVTFNNVDKTGFIDFESMDVTEVLSPTDGYVEYSCSGFWNGTGDFKLTFTGDIYLYMLVLSTDKLESLVNKYKTLFEQSERLVKISAAVFDKNEQALQETGLLVTSEMAGLYAIGEDGNLKSFVGAGQDGVKIKASNIDLEGVTTINGRFKILADGSMEADKAKIKNSELDSVLITGAIKTPFRDGKYRLTPDGPISNSITGLQNNNNVVIPGDTYNADGKQFYIPFTPEYNGFRTIIMNDDFGGKNVEGDWEHTAPEGKYYLEDGQKKKKLTLLPYTGVEMIGYGDGDTFHGWIILKRIYKDAHYGYPFRVMFFGIVRRGELYKKKTYNNEKLKYQRLDAGHYRISFEAPFSSKDNYAVFLTGLCKDSGRYASVIDQTETYFDVYTGDDDSPNDADFQFMVINTSDMYMDDFIWTNIG